MPETIRIDRRFCGPPDSGNGGYVAGVVAHELGSSGVAVTLHLPPPLDRQLQLGSDRTNAWLKDGDALIATAEKRELALNVPSPPTFVEAERAQSRYAGFRHHNFPGCFVCGPERRPGDALRIFPGSRGGGQVAAIWEPDGSLLDEADHVRPEFVWAALDCPGYWSVASTAGIAVLGRLTATIFVDRLPREPMIVTSWPIRSEGRKHEAGTAVHDRDGRRLAAAKATWITLKS